MPTNDEQEPIYFFLSYSHKDQEPYLSEFYKRLDKEVHRHPISGETLDLGQEKKLREKLHLSFRDVNSMHPGDRWPEVLAKRAQYSRVLVALYSYSYFSRPYCGKEFQVFLKRRLELRNSCAEKIIPLFWDSKEALAFKQLPPENLKYIHDNDISFPKSYLDKGLRALTRNPRSESYLHVLETVANRIIDLAEKDPLPPHPTPLDLNEIENAFEEITASDRPSEVEGDGPWVVQLLLTDQLPSEASTSMEDEQGALGMWRPFGTGSPNLSDILDQAFRPHLATHRWKYIIGVKPLMATLSASEGLRIVLIDDAFLTTPEGQEVENWIAQTEVTPVLVLCGGQKPQAIATHDEREGKFTCRDKVELLGSAASLLDRLSALIPALQQLAVEKKPVVRKPEGEGPTARPLLRGPGKVE